MGVFEHPTVDDSPPLLLRAVPVISLTAALCSLPLPTNGNSPDVSAISIVISVAVLAGHRWALPLLCVLSGVILSQWVPLFANATPAWTIEYACLLGTCVLAVPGILASLRVGPMLGELLGLGAIFRRTAHMLAPVAIVILTMALGVL